MSDLLDAVLIWGALVALLALAGGIIWAIVATALHGLRMLRNAAFIWIALLCGASASPLWVAGDSIGVGIAQVGHLPSVAKVGVSMSVKSTAAQLVRVPVGSSVIVSLGTNDAVAGITDAPVALERFFVIARDRHLILIWAGPPCVLKKWDVSAHALSDWLAGQVTNAGYRYVSQRGGAWCSGVGRAGDGVHFTSKGYATLLARLK